MGSPFTFQRTKKSVVRTTPANSKKWELLASLSAQGVEARLQMRKPSKRATAKLKNKPVFRVVCLNPWNPKVVTTLGLRCSTLRQAEKCLQAVRQALEEPDITLEEISRRGLVGEFESLWGEIEEDDPEHCKPHPEVKIFQQTVGAEGEDNTQQLTFSLEEYPIHDISERYRIVVKFGCHRAVLAHCATMQFAIHKQIQLAHYVESCTQTYSLTDLQDMILDDKKRDVLLNPFWLQEDQDNDTGVSASSSTCTTTTTTTTITTNGPLSPQPAIHFSVPILCYNTTEVMFGFIDVTTAFSARAVCHCWNSLFLRRLDCILHCHAAGSRRARKLYQTQSTDINILNTIEKENMRLQPSQTLQHYLHTYSLVCNTSRVILSLSAFLPSIAIGTVLGPFYGVAQTCSIVHANGGLKWALPLAPLCALVGLLAGAVYGAYNGGKFMLKYAPKNIALRCVRRILRTAVKKYCSTADSLFMWEYTGLHHIGGPQSTELEKSWVVL